jgi:arginine deiminase
MKKKIYTKEFFNGIDRTKLVIELEILKNELKKLKLLKEALDIKVAIEAETKNQNELILFLGYSSVRVIEIAREKELYVAVNALKKSKSCYFIIA